MGRKRKSRATASATPQEPQHVLPAEPEPEPELVPEEVREVEREPEMDLEPEPEPSQAVEALEEDPGVEEQEVEDEDNPEEEEKEDPEEEEEEDDDGITENTEGRKDEDVSTEPATNDLESGTKVKPSEIGDDGGETGGHYEEGEDDLEEEPLEKLLEPFSKDQLTVLIKEAVARHPDIMENVHQFADSDPAHCKIFVHGLGWEANTETITSVFGKYGQIEDCKVVKDKNSGKSKGYGFILFKHRDGARRALKQPQKLIEGRMTSCQLASAGPVQSTPPPPVVAALSSPSVSEYTQRKIYVSNVSAEVDPKKLFEFFSRFGEIEEGPLGLDKLTGKPRGFCLFVYRTLESAKKALEEPHKHFDGQILHCQKAIDGPKHSRGYFNQQHGQPQQQHQQHHHQGHQGFYHPAKKGRYAGSSGVGHTSGHLMAPSAGPGVPTMGFNPAVAPAALGQAVAALLATQGAGLGIGNLLGGIGAGVNQQGVPPMMNNAGYGGPAGAGGYGGQAGMQGGYGGQPQMGPGAVRPHQGGAPYMGHGH